MYKARLKSRNKGKRWVDDRDLQYRGGSKFVGSVRVCTQELPENPDEGAPENEQDESRGTVRARNRRTTARTRRRRRFAS